MKYPRLLALLAAIGPAGCVPPPRVPPPTPVRPPSVVPPRPTVPPVVDANTVSPGAWSYAQDSRATRATFGVAGGMADFFVSCDLATRRIVVAIRDVPGQAPSATMTLRATTATATYAAVPDAFGYHRADLAATDPILDALAFSRGRFTVIGGSLERRLPTWPEFTRVVEDCRG